MVNFDEAKGLVALASAVDNRQITDITVNEWMHALHDLEIGDCVEALREHRREKPGVYLEPGHIAAGVKRIIATANQTAARQLTATYDKPWHPAPSRDLMDRMSAAHRDPVLSAALRTEYHDELRAAGFDPDQGSRDVPPSTTPFFRGQGRDFAIPVGDR